MSHPDSDGPLEIQIGHHEIVIRKRYEVLSIVNDILVGVWFLIGSVMFFSDAWVTIGTWLFVGGSAELLIRPIIRLSRHVHLRRIGATPLPTGGSTSQEY